MKELSFENFDDAYQELKRKENQLSEALSSKGPESPDVMNALNTVHRVENYLLRNYKGEWLERAATDAGMGQDHFPQDDITSKMEFDPVGIMKIPGDKLKKMINPSLEERELYRRLNEQDNYHRDSPGTGFYEGAD